ncbi:hypothetical protein ACEWY4_000973 [Coilia grayii]|uniref:Peptidase S1 domain-containing protein n=1 Tax=Coilia grayii TaxID=363190 RepID=A0ABD1KY84_9TELE
MNLCGRLLCVLSFVSVCTILYFGILEEESFHLDTDCGKRPDRGVPGFPRAKRFLGRPVKLGAWPWVVSLQYRSSHSSPFVQRCAGAVIYKDWILTTATCFYQPAFRNLSDWRIKTGTEDLNNDGSHTQTASIEAIILHRDYQPKSKYQDIALVKLATPLEFNDYVDRICIPDKMIVEEFKYGECYIAGYDGPMGYNPGLLKESHVTLFPSNQCNMMTWRKFTVAANMFCAGGRHGYRDGCETNIGGPISCFVPATKRYYVKGIRIVANKCGVPRRPNIYLQVSKHFHWIARKIDNYEKGP